MYWPEFIAKFKSITLKQAEEWLKGSEVEDGDVEFQEKEEKIISNILTKFNLLPRLKNSRLTIFHL